MQTSFVDNMAAFLGISMDRIRIVNVRHGSTIVDFVIDQDTSNPTSSSTTNTSAANAASAKDLNA